MSLLRTVLVALSGSSMLQRATARIPPARRMSSRFVAGETLQQAIDAVLALNRQGFVATLDHLGENVATPAEAGAAAGEYVRALDALHAAGARSNISVKLTQLGLDQADDLCYANVASVVQKAVECGNFVRIDMEGSAYTERTLVLYRRLRREFTNAGVAIQSYLFRSEGDVSSLIAHGYGHFRLVKGAYDEPPTIAFTHKARVTQALNDLIRTCMQRGAYCAVASHDEAVVNYARAYAYQHGVPGTAFEFQMLYGIRRELQTQLVRQGYTVRIYVPYGAHWYPYLMRRLAERPANLLFFLRALAGN